VFQTYEEAAAALASTGIAAGDPLALPIAEARARQAAYFTALNGELPAIARTDDLAIDGPYGSIPLRLHRPSLDAPLPTIVFVRGAGWWAGSLDSHARTLRSLALLTGCAVCGVDLRRTPEHRYPVQRDELLATLYWLRVEGAQHGLDGAAPVLFGESAGATLALSAAISMRDANLPPVAGLVLFYANAAGPNPKARAQSQWVWRQYLGHDGPSTDPGAVPLLDPLHGLPPVWLGVGDTDPLLPDTLALDERLTAAGNRPELHRYPGMPHAFVMWTGSLAPALGALKDAAAAARAFLKVPAPPAT
jgi:acetyl esterase